MPNDNYAAIMEVLNFSGSGNYFIQRVTYISDLQTIYQRRIHQEDGVGEWNAFEAMIHSTQPISVITDKTYLESNLTYYIKNGWCFVQLESNMKSIPGTSNTSVIATGLPKPILEFMTVLTTGNGGYNARVAPDGTLQFWYPYHDLAERIDCCFSYPIA